MGKLDQRFAEIPNALVMSRKGFPRYSKRFNAKGNRKLGRTHTLGFPNFGVTNAMNGRIGRRYRVD